MIAKENYLKNKRTKKFSLDLITHDVKNPTNNPQDTNKHINMFSVLRP